MSNYDQIAGLPPAQRSRITNARMKQRVGSRALLMETDGRTAWARRYKDLCAILIDDLGGMASLSELKLGLIRRAATLMLACERFETDLAEGRPVDLDQLGRLVGHVRRIAETLGLDRVVKDVTPTLADIVREHAKTVEQKPSPSPFRKPAEILDLFPATDAPASTSDASSTPPEPAQEAAE